jgi:ATP-dependent 26S proteasome regulatory subunit
MPNGLPNSYVMIDPSSFFRIARPAPRNVEEERDQLRAEVARLGNVIKTIEEAPVVLAVVVDVVGDHVYYNAKGNTFVRRKWDGVQLLRGQSIEVLVNGGSIVRPVQIEVGYGAITTVARLVPGGTAEVDVGPARMLVIAQEGTEVGDRVCLDETGTAVVRNLGKAQQELAYSEATGVTWDDVVGQEEAKRALREAVEEPYVHREVYERFGRGPTKGILLYGPPGNGKTMLGKAAATCVAQLHGAGGSEGGFIYVKGPEMLNMYVGSSEASVRRLFTAARRHMEKRGYPAVIFIDEADALLGSRDRERGVEGMERTIVPQFLSEMDGMDASGAMVLLATNRPEALDSAVVRSKRVDRKVLVGRPTKHEFALVVERGLRGRPLDAGITGAYLAQLAADEAYGRLGVFALEPVSKDEEEVVAYLGDFASGAMAAAVAEGALQRAIRRALAGDERGVCSADVGEAVREQYAQLDLSAAAEVLAPIAQRQLRSGMARCRRVDRECN